jgi:hypothetical protein
MRMRNVVPGLLVAASLMAAVPAHAVMQPGKARLRASLGFTTLTLGDINDEIRSARDAFRADTLTDESSWDPFGGATNLGVEVDVQITPVVSAGIGFGAHRSSIRHNAFRILSIDVDTGEPAEFEHFDEHAKLSSWDVVGTLGLWVPSAPGLHFGAQAGLVRGTLDRESWYLVESFSVLANMQQRVGAWSGTGVVLGAFTGYEHPITSQLAFSTRVGYRYRKIGRPSGTLLTTDWGDQGNSRETESGPLLDAAGNRMAIDLGGFYFNVGIGMSLGGGE